MPNIRDTVAVLTMLGVAPVALKTVLRGSSIDRDTAEEVLSALAVLGVATVDANGRWRLADEIPVSIRALRPDDTSVVLRSKQAAALLGVSPSTLREWSDLGLVAHVRTPRGHRRYSRVALECVSRLAGGEIAA